MEVKANEEGNSKKLLILPSGLGTKNITFLFLLFLTHTIATRHN